MATIVIPNVAQVAIEQSCSGQPVVNVLHFQYINGALPLPSADLVAIKNAWEKTAGPLKLKANIVSMVGYKYTFLGSAQGSTEYLASSALGGSGTAISTMAASALVKLGGGTRDRSGSGRIYHGPLQEGDINADGRTLSTVANGAIQLAYQTFRNDLALLGMELVVASRKNLTARAATNISASSIIATQRRRLR